MNEPKEPDCPNGRKPHRERVRDIDRILKEGRTAGICIDNTKEHRAFYLHEIAKYPRLLIEHQGRLSDGIYLIRVRKLPSTN